MTTGKRQIARAAGVVMVAFVASRALGLGREMIISRYFGTSADYDAYLAAFRLPDILFQLVAGGALGSAFIPMFTSYLARGDEEGAWRLASAVVNLILLILTSLAVIAALLAPQVVALIAPGFPPGQRALAAELMRLMLISPVVFGVSGIVMGILNSHQHFLLPALAPSMYNLSIIGGAVFLAPRLGVRGLAIGVVIGAGLHLLIQVPGLLRVGTRYFPMLGLRHPGVHEVGRLMLPRTLGLAIVQLNFLVNTILASELPAGSLSALNYAFLLMLLPQGIFAQAIATVAFPTFAAQFARDEVAEMRSTLSATLRTILYLTIPASVGLYLPQPGPDPPPGPRRAGPGQFHRHYAGDDRAAGHSSRAVARSGGTANSRLAGARRDGGSGDGYDGVGFRATGRGSRPPDPGDRRDHPGSRGLLCFNDNPPLGGGRDARRLGRETFGYLRWFPNPRKAQVSNSSR